jgi:pectate lyase
MKIHKATTSALPLANSHRLRSAVTMLGIVIGIACLIPMMSMGDGAKERLIFENRTHDTLAAAADTAGLIQQLKSSDPAEVDSARERLLERGPDAIPALEDALEKSQDPALNKVLSEISERLQLRASVQQLAAKWGERWYSFRNRGVKVGWLRLKVEQEGDVLVMSDTLFFTSNGQESRTLHTVKSRPNEYLSPISLFIETRRPEKPWVIDGEVIDGSLRVKPTRPGEEGVAQLKPNFTTEFAVMRLATLVPKTKGYEVSLLEIWEKPAIQDAVLKFDKAEEIDLDGDSVKTSRFTLSNPHSADRTYWVDDMGQLVKMRVYGRIEFVLTDEKSATDIVMSVPQAKTSRPPAKPSIKSPLPVFPGAEGFGTRTPAGRGGKVIAVTSLANRGPGTLREALADPNPRIIVFRVGGTIEVDTPLPVDHPFVTVAGQTAPGDGIQIKNAGIQISTHDVLIQHLRIRPGNEGDIDPENNDAIQLNGGANVVIDHVSASWGEDETVQTWFGAHDITFSWCVVSEALDKSRHPKGRHGGGFLIGDGSDRVTVHHCLMAHNDFRNPLISQSGLVEFVENAIYNWGRSAAEIYTDQKTDRTTQVNFIGNVYIPGPSSPPEQFELVLNSEPKAGIAPPRIYAKGNRGPHRTSSHADEYAFISLGWGGVRLPDEYHASTPFETRNVSRLQGSDLTNAVLAGVGATLPRRDAVDQRVVESIQKRDGQMINSPLVVGGYPNMKGGQPPVDSDHDGMPDVWEQKMGFHPQDPADAARDHDGDGYTNIEEYLHSLVNRR